MLISGAAHVARRSYSYCAADCFCCCCFVDVHFSFVIHTWPICILIGYLCFAKGSAVWLWTKMSSRCGRGGGGVMQRHRPYLSVGPCSSSVGNADDPPDHNEQNLPGQTVVLISDRDLTFCIYSVIFFWFLSSCLLLEGPRSYYIIRWSLPPAL